jgi:Zinc finger, C3HC4 type (RING finger)
MSYFNKWCVAKFVSVGLCSASSVLVRSVTDRDLSPHDADSVSDFQYHDTDTSLIVDQGFNGYDETCIDVDTDYDVLGIDEIQLHNDKLNQLRTIVDFLADDSTLFNSLFPSNLPACDRDIARKSIFKKVRKVFNDPHLLSELTSSEPALQVPTICSEPKDCSDLWNELVNDHKCMICSDLLACPVILGCSHSFCGSCVKDLTDAWESDDTDVIHTCPTCRQEIDNKIFEMILDDIIAQKVAEIPDCEPKRDWIKRRESYQKSRKNETLEKIYRDEDPSTPEYVIVGVAVVVTVALAMVTAYKRNRR